MARKILHLDLDAFFCSVEEQRTPSLAGKPFAVGGRPDQRGVVASCSYPARMKGVHSAMPMGQALRLCPGLIIVPGQHADYEAVSRQVMERLHRLTERVEQISIDEAFLDLSDLPDPPEQIARRLQATIQTELGLPCSLGAAGSKLVAKIANDVGKAAHRTGEAPRAITVVPPGEEAAFLGPLPAELLWGVGPKTATRLAEIGVTTIGALAQAPEAELKRLFGKNGSDMRRHAQGLDDSEVVTFHEPRSVSQETTFARDVRDEAALRQELTTLALGAGRRLRETGRLGATVKLKLRWSDFTTITRQSTLPAPTDDDEIVLQAALALFEKHWPKGRPVRLIGVGVSGLKLPTRQLSLWEAPLHAEHPSEPPPAPLAPGAEARRRLEAALAELEQKFGSRVIRRGPV